MSILIKGMEMPKACYECRMYEADIYYCAAAERDIDIPSTDEGRCSFCPIVPIPPHGDLIERDKAMRDLRMDYAYAAARIVSLQPIIVPAEEEPAKGINVPTKKEEASDYKKLIDSLRICGDSVDAIDECSFEECIQHERPIDPLCMKALCHKAADAIEELRRREKFHAFIWKTLGFGYMRKLEELYQEEEESDV